MRTDQLIVALARDVQPVRPLPRPWRRAMLWAVAGLAYLAVLGALASPRDDSGVRLGEPRFLIEQGAALLTGLSAAAAALALSIPGSSQRIILAPLAFFGMWIATLTWGAVQDVRIAGLAPGTDWGCVAVMLAGAAGPASLIAVMLRRGAPLIPRVTAALAALAAAALGSLAVCAVPHTSLLVVLVWHGGTVVALALVAGTFGRHLLVWRRLVPSQLRG